MTAPEGMSDTGKDRIRGGYGKRKFCDACLSVVSIKVSGRERGTSVEENRFLSKLIGGWEEGFVDVLFILLSLPLV